MRVAIMGPAIGDYAVVGEATKLDDGKFENGVLKLPFVSASGRVVKDHLFVRPDNERMGIYRQGRLFDPATLHGQYPKPLVQLLYAVSEGKGEVLRDSLTRALQYDYYVTQTALIRYLNAVRVYYGVYRLLTDDDMGTPLPTPGRFVKAAHLTGAIMRLLGVRWNSVYEEAMTQPEYEELAYAHAMREADARQAIQSWVVADQEPFVSYERCAWWREVC